MTYRSGAPKGLAYVEYEDQVRNQQCGGCVVGVCVNRENYSS